MVSGEGGGYLHTTVGSNGEVRGYLLNGDGKGRKDIGKDVGKGQKVAKVVRDIFRKSIVNIVD